MRRRKICIELRIDTHDVRRRLMRTSKPKVMVKTEIAEYEMDVTVGAAFYISKLSKDRVFVGGLQPDLHTRWARIQSQTLTNVT